MVIYVLRMNTRPASDPALQAAAVPRTEGRILRAATAADAIPAAELIYLPMGSLADYLFGSDDRAQAIDVLSKLFVQRDNRFSFQHSSILEVDSQVAGLLLAYPGHRLSNLSLRMGSQLRQVLGWSGMIRLLRRSLPLMGHKECEPDEFYIYTLAVHPDFQNSGLGTQLLTHAETRAAACGLSKCSLGVTIGNDGARRLYERWGYVIVDTVRVPKLQKAIGYPGYYRMVKNLIDQSRIST